MRRTDCQSASDDDSMSRCGRNLLCIAAAGCAGHRLLILMYIGQSFGRLEVCADLGQGSSDSLLGRSMFGWDRSCCRARLSGRGRAVLDEWVLILVCFVEHDTPFRCDRRVCVDGAASALSQKHRIGHACFWCVGRSLLAGAATQSWLQLWWSWLRYRRKAL